MTKPKRWWLFGILGVLVLVLVGLAIALFQPAQRTSPEAQDKADKAAPPAPSNATASSTAAPSGASTPFGPGGGTPGQSQPVSVANCADYLSPDCTRRALRDKDFALQVLHRQVERNPQAQRYMQAVIQQMQPFKFVGQVVDTQGNPIAGAEVTYQLGYPYSLGYTQTACTKTDTNGRFQLQDRAWSLFIRTIEVPGLVPAPGFYQHREFSWQNRPGLTSWQQASAGRPQRFVMQPGRAAL